VAASDRREPGEPDGLDGLAWSDPEVALRIRALANGEGNPLIHMIWLDRALPRDEYELVCRLAIGNRAQVGPSR
jgi:hypothetical protein